MMVKIRIYASAVSLRPLSTLSTYRVLSPCAPLTGLLGPGTPELPEASGGASEGLPQPPERCRSTSVREPFPGQRLPHPTASFPGLSLPPDGAQLR